MAISLPRTIVTFTPTTGAKEGQWGAVASGGSIQIGSPAQPLVSPNEVIMLSARIVAVSNVTNQCRLELWSPVTQAYQFLNIVCISNGAAILLTNQIGLRLASETNWDVAVSTKTYNITP